MPVLLLVPSRLCVSREAFFSPSKTVSAHDAIGLASAETVCPYPPGELVSVFVLHSPCVSLSAAVGVSVARWEKTFFWRKKNSITYDTSAFFHAA